MVHKIRSGVSATLILSGFLRCRGLLVESPSLCASYVKTSWSGCESGTILEEIDRDCEAIRFLMFTLSRSHASKIAPTQTFIPSALSEMRAEEL